MIATHEAIVASRFDALHGRFKRDVAPDDPRLLAIVDSLGAAGRLPRPRPGLRQGAVLQGAERPRRRGGRARPVARRCSPRRQAWIGSGRSARRLPFASASFDGVVAVEVFEHLAPRSLDQVCAKSAVCSGRGDLRHRRQERLVVERQRPWLPSWR